LSRRCRRHVRTFGCTLKRRSLIIRFRSRTTSSDGTPVWSARNTEMTLFVQRFDAYEKKGQTNHVYSEKDHSTSSHDFLLSRPTTALIILVRKLKCVTSTRRLHKHCRATPSRPDLAAKLDMSFAKQVAN
jgi:hypothetical protein